MKRSEPLRVVMFTPWFYPHLGGVETATDLLGTGLCEQGCEVVIITTLASDVPERGRAYRVLRRGGVGVWWREVRYADVVLMFGASLRFIFIPLLQRKPFAVHHYSWTPWRDRPLTSLAQRLLSRLACNVVASEVMAQHFGGRAIVLPYPFDDGLFRSRSDVARERDLVFLGRLVEEKGLGTLLQALAQLHQQGQKLRLSIVGRGHAEPQFRALAAQLGIESSVDWCGPMSGEPLARKLAEHRVMVVPSLWREPFGIVAVEGLACGCEVVVSTHGGLLEAVGSVGVPFNAGDPQSLGEAIATALARSATPRAATEREAQVSRFRARAAATHYLNLLRTLAPTALPTER